MSKTIHNTLIRDARNLAIKAHEGQTYTYGPLGELEKLPYWVHLHDVTVVLHEAGLKSNYSELFAAAWLHDTLEDTTVTETEIQDALYMPFTSHYVDAVLEIVRAVTNPTGGNRAQRHAISYPKIAADRRATAVKLADRIANLTSGGKTEMYLKEHTFFFGSLFPNHFERMTNPMVEFDDLDVVLRNLWTRYHQEIERIKKETGQ